MLNGHYVRTEEIRRKIGLASKGRKHTEETKIKIGIGNKGKKLSEETKRKIGLGNSKPKIRNICGFCGKEFFNYPNEKKRKYCSFQCYWKSIKGKSNLLLKGRKFPERSGKNHPNWKGTTSLYEYIRKLEEYTIWRKIVFKRDDYTCQECFERGYKLQAHHKKDFKIIFAEFLIEYSQFSPIEDREVLIRLATNYKPFWDINNGRTLCKECHSLIPNLGQFKPQAQVPPGPA